MTSFWGRYLANAILIGDIRLEENKVWFSAKTSNKM